MARKQLLRRDEVTPDYLNVIAEETSVPHREVLNYVARIEHEAMPGNAGYMLMKVRTEDKGRRAAVVGFLDRSIPVAGDSFREILVSPFYMKIHTPYNASTPGAALQNGELQIPEDTIVSDTAALERMRLNTVTEAFLAMVGYQSFTYMDNPDPDKAKVNFTISYAADITPVPDAGAGAAVDFSDPAVKTAAEIELAKTAYANAPGIDFSPDTCFVSGATYAQLLSVPDIQKKHQPVQPSDPDLTGEVFEAFDYGGLRWVKWRKGYNTNAGVVDALPEGLAVLTVAADPRDGLAPMRWHALQDLFNDNDASAPKFDYDTDGAKDSPQARLLMYDNGLPAPSRRYIMRTWRLYTP